MDQFYTHISYRILRRCVNNYTLEIDLTLILPKTSIRRDNYFCLYLTVLLNRTHFLGNQTTYGLILITLKLFVKNNDYCKNQRVLLLVIFIFSGNSITINKLHPFFCLIDIKTNSQILR